MRYRLRKLLIPNGPPIGLTALALVAVLVLIAILAWRFFLYAMSALGFVLILASGRIVKSS